MWAIKLTTRDRETGRVLSEDLTNSRYTTREACQSMADEMAAVMNRNSTACRFGAEPVMVGASPVEQVIRISQAVHCDDGLTRVIPVPLEFPLPVRR